ncbi:MAG: ribonuclease M5 [Firmicutes bacterium]|nr:ribonuclease M5 [Bacillota bacterium]
MTTKIREIIVVEGRDDTAAVKRAVCAETIETHGFGISGETWKLLEKANEERGIIILTDPDHAGEEIRKRLAEKFPDAKQAYISREKAVKSGDVGVENASPEAIAEALEKARAQAETAEKIFTMEDLMKAGLSGRPASKEKRQKAGEILGIGYGSSSRFLGKLNGYGITREEFEEALEKI